MYRIALYFVLQYESLMEGFVFMLNYLLTRESLTEEQNTFLSNYGCKAEMVCEIMSEIFYRIVSPGKVLLNLDVHKFGQCVIFSKISDNKWNLLAPEETRWHITEMPECALCEQLEESFF